MVESLKKAEAHLERVTVEVNVEGAEIRIGDVDLGVSPLPFAWYLEPGSYDVRVSKPGFVAYSETRLARAGNAQHLRIHLKPLTVPEERVPIEPPPPPAAAAASPPELDRGPNPWLLVAGGTLTAGGLVTGLTLSLFAADNADKVDRLGDALDDPSSCRAPVSADCVELADAAAAHDRQVRWATVSFALGAAAGVSTVVYALLAGSSRHGSLASPGPGPRSLGVAFEANGTQLVLDGSF
jgi:hypothetical protein